MGTISIIYFRRSLFVFASVCVTDDFYNKKKKHILTHTAAPGLVCVCAYVGKYTNTVTRFISRLHLNYCTTNHYNQAYLPPIGKGSWTPSHYFHFSFFIFLCTTKSTLHFFSSCMASNMDTITYSLLFIFDGIFTFNGCNLTH